MRYAIPILVLIIGVTLRFGADREVPDLPAFDDAELADIAHEARTRQAQYAATLGSDVTITSNPTAGAAGSPAPPRWISWPSLPRSRD